MVEAAIDAGCGDEVISDLMGQEWKGHIRAWQGVYQLCGGLWYGGGMGAVVWNLVVVVCSGVAVGGRILMMPVLLLRRGVLPAML